MRSCASRVKRVPICREPRRICSCTTLARAGANVIPVYECCDGTIASDQNVLVLEVRGAKYEGRAVELWVKKSGKEELE